MQNKRTLIMISLLLLLSTGAVVTWAQTGGGYDLTWHTLDSGGGLSSGGDYSINSTIGQPDAGTLSGGEYSLQGGFWHANCVPPAVVNPTIALSNNDVELSWLPVNQADSYNIYRDTVPYFVAAAVYQNSTTSPWLDPGAVGNPALNYFYLMRSVSCGESGNSQRSGEFDFALVPGS
ncbi:MAG: hypothetical protein KC419_00855 [Anaerolineales bacterium]|nr:hypothetical protein [Anaerolineales bacterium]